MGAVLDTLEPDDFRKKMEAPKPSTTNNTTLTTTMARIGPAPPLPSDSLMVMPPVVLSELTVPPRTGSDLV